MSRARRAAAAVLSTVALSAAGVVAMPAANAGILADPEAGGPPVAYTVDGDNFPASCELSRIDLTTGAVTSLGSPSPDACVADLAVAPDGSVWGIGPSGGASGPVTGELVHFDATTGAVLSVTTITGDFTVQFVALGGLAFDAAGTLYAQLVTDEPGCDEEAVCLYTLDRETAGATFVGAPGDAFFESFLAFLAADCGTALDTVVPQAVIIPGESSATPWGDSGATSHDDRESLASYDPASGALTEVAHFPNEDEFTVGLDYSRADGTLYALVAPLLLPSEAGAEAETGDTTEVSESTEATTETTVATEATAAGDVYAQAFEASLYRVDPATGALTLVAPLDPDLNVAMLGIAGSCTVEPVVLQPTFTG